MVTTRTHYRGKTDGERRTERRDRLLDAALEVFGQQGYSAGTVDLICKTARVSPRHFYEHFEGRDDLLTVLSDRVMAEALQASQDALDRAPDNLEARISMAVEAFLHTFLDDPSRATVAILEVNPVGGSGDRGQHSRQAFARFIAAEAERSGVITDPTIAEIVITGLVGAANTVCSDWLRAPPENRPDRNDLTYAITRLFLAASEIPPRPSTEGPS